MRLYVVHHFEPGHAVTPSFLSESDTAFAFTMRLTEGQVAEFDIERRQTGWSILGSDERKYATVLWSPTDDPADAVPIAVGRMSGLPDDLLASTQTVTYECSPTDIDDRLLAWCRTNLASAPETDLLYADADPETVETYLLGRSGNLAVDPVTYDISLDDDLLGGTVHDLSTSAFVSSSGRGVYDRPVRTYRAVLTCDWTQEASGEVDIASRLPEIRTLDAGFASRLDQSLSAVGAEGWSTTGGAETRVRIREQGAFYVGAAYQSTRSRSLVYYPQVNGNIGAGQVVGRADSVVVTTHDLAPVYARYDVDVQKWPLAYSYSQARRDVCHLALGAGIQTSAIIDEADAEVLEWSLGDIFVDVSYPAWAPDEDYAAGDHVRNGDGYFECVAAHRSGGFFDEDRGVLVRRPIPGTSPVVYDTTRTYWLRIRPTTVVDPASTTKFLSTARGLQAIRHGMFRLRKEARRRLRAWHVNVVLEWADGIGIGIPDSVRVLVPWDTEGAYRAVVGKVVGIERRWYGGRCPVVELELGVPFGLGGVPQPANAEYVVEGYVDDGHFDGTPETDVEFVVEADPPDVPVDAFRLRSPNYALKSCTVLNQASEQAQFLGQVLTAGGDATDVSVRKPTAVRLNLRPLAVSSEPLVRELDAVGELLVTPQGIDLS